MPKCFERKRLPGLIPKRQHEIAPYTNNRDNQMENGALAQPTNQLDKGGSCDTQRGATTNVFTTAATAAKKSRSESETAKSGYKIQCGRRPPPPPPPPPPPLPPSQPIPLPFDKVIVEPIVPVEVPRPSTKPLGPRTSVRSYTIAALQQYTNSFSQDNLIGVGMLGSVYRAQLPNGKLFAVKKLEKRVISQQKEEDFIELVNNLDRIRHANVVELMGYCSEHGCTPPDDDDKKKLPWNARIRMALGAARALEYLHELCEPPIIHRNFKSANVLLDEDLSVRVSDCGLAPLISRGSVTQLSGHLLSTFVYGAPEFESGIYTSMSDVYSFGVVMLELLTGRKAYDNTLQRGEQSLVRWAVHQLHDIDALSRMVDPSLNGEYPVKSLSNFADIISRCVQAEPEFRPPMSEVVQDLIQMIRRESSNRSDGD
ncbi:hypothetical protein OSB04_014152 [Centaurea solstitialis]|uniref:Protein kinase domain-containing protein n=1 Tax=Centaurea solstitialis TaxID=347529 RepID=A0AA38TEW6_9ASTR|nr:hypothetical protein OSB04_014152 [Centaurea solstitialis]